MLWIPYGLKTHDWRPVEAIGIVIIFFGIAIYIDTRYRICWQDGKVVQRAANGAITTIKVDEIERIEQETSDLQTLLSMSRPFRRITIYGNTSEGMKVIDVSLKHFNLDDVRKLMKVIHDHRPDLPMPQNWV